MAEYFYNTIDENGDDLNKSKRHAKMQEQVVLLLFISNPTLEATPFEVLESLNLKNTPITSIRRAMTNLTDKGKLIKMEKKKIEQFGKANHCWKLNEYTRLDNVKIDKKKKIKKTKKQVKKQADLQQTLF